MTTMDEQVDNSRQSPEQEHAEEAMYLAALKFAVLICVLATGVMVVWSSDAISFTDVEGLRGAIDAAGVWGPMIYIGLFAASVVFALPATVITLVGAALFEPVAAYFIILTGAMLGAMVSFGLGRWLGRDFVAQILSARQENVLVERIARLDDALATRGLLTMTYLRLGHLPYFLPSYLGALSKISVSAYFWGTLLGSIPNTFVFVFLGDTLRDAWVAGTWEALWTWRTPVALTLLLASILAPWVIDYVRGRADTVDASS